MEGGGAVEVKVGVIGGSGFYRLEALQGAHTIQVHNLLLLLRLLPSSFHPLLQVETPWGEVSMMGGRVGEVEVVVLARHGTSHTLPPSEVNYRANMWALRCSVV